MKPAKYLLVGLLGLLWLLYSAEASVAEKGLQQIYDACFAPEDLSKWPQQWRRKQLHELSLLPIRFRYRSPTAARFEFCVYDILCERISYVGWIEPRMNVHLSICKDDRWKGHILIFDKEGYVFRFDDLYRNQLIYLPPR